MRFVPPFGTAVGPFERKLPLLIAALLCVVVGAFSWRVSHELTAAFERAAGARLGFAAQRLATMLSESGTSQRVDIRAIVGDSAVRLALESPTPARLAAAESLLARHNGVLVPSRALWTTTCDLVLATGPRATRAELRRCPAGPEERARIGGNSAGVVRPLRTLGDTVVFTSAAPVLRGADTVGYVSSLRNVAGGQGVHLLADLIDRDADVMFGNAEGPAVWTNFERAVPGPPRLAERGVPTLYTPDTGAVQLGVALNIASTPWMVWVQMPHATAVQGVRQTMRSLIIAAVFCVVVGVIAAWSLSNHVTRPILELKRAAETIAAGDYSRRVRTTRTDELGQLVSSFNAMAEQVETANRELGFQASELYRHFAEAQELARQLELSNKELNAAFEDMRIVHAERQLVQSLLDEVLAQAPVGIAVFDRELRYVRLNQALAMMNGVHLDEHVGRTPGEVAPGRGTIAEAALQRVLATGETIADQRSAAVLAGRDRRQWLSSYFPVRGAGDEVVGVGAIILDTTARHELEARLLQSQKMEAVGRLAGGVAHDFNNLLTVISSYSEMALETLSPTDALYADMQEIRGSADRASRLTRQLLAFSRKQVLQPQVLDLNHVTTEMERMLRRLIGEDVALVLDLEHDIADVRADPGQVEQVLMNLVLNARDAMPEGGRLVLATRNATLAAALCVGDVTVPPGAYVTLSVSDTGTGMSADTLAHLFEPFFTTKETGQGTGLGLSTVYGIAKQSGGEIVVSSVEGEGSTFTLYLPRIVRARSRSAAGSALDRPFAGSETILLVEDDDALRMLACRVLRGAGYRVLEARGGSAALEVERSNAGTIDLLLTDVVMPQMNGRVVADLVSLRRPGIRVLFMSGYTDDDVMKRGISAVQTEFLSKPFTPEQLTRCVRAVLDRRPTDSPPWGHPLQARPADVAG